MAVFVRVNRDSRLSDISSSSTISLPLLPLSLLSHHISCFLRTSFTSKRITDLRISPYVYPHIPSFFRCHRFRRISRRRTINSLYPPPPQHQHNNRINMLLPSALPCDMRRRPTRFTSTRLISPTPPPSDPAEHLPESSGSGSGSGNGLLGTCRALQNLLNGSPAPSPAPTSRRTKPSRLQSPALIRSSPASNTRSRKSVSRSSCFGQASSKTPSQAQAQNRMRQRQRPRGVNKRRRSVYENDLDMDVDMDVDGESHSSGKRHSGFSTPKRRRHLPYDLPLGLSQSDFYSLHSPPISQSPPHSYHNHNYLEYNNNNNSSQYQPSNPDNPLPSIEEADEMPPHNQNPSTWSPEDDQRLVELVLDNFRLSRRDVDVCARRLGRDGESVGRRWRDLVGDGIVGLRGSLADS